MRFTKGGIKDVVGNTLYFLLLNYQKNGIWKYRSRLLTLKDLTNNYTT